MGVLQEQGERRLLVEELQRTRERANDITQASHPEPTNAPDSNRSCIMQASQGAVEMVEQSRAHVRTLEAERNELQRVVQHERQRYHEVMQEVAESRVSLEMRLNAMESKVSRPGSRGGARSSKPMGVW